jgi:hypothetical protein
MENGDCPQKRSLDPSPEEQDTQSADNHRWGKLYSILGLTGAKQ